MHITFIFLFRHTGPKLISSQSQRLSKRVNERAPLKPSSAPPQRPVRILPSKVLVLISSSNFQNVHSYQITDRQRALFHAQLTPPKPAKPAAKLSNLFGLIDTSKLQSIFGNSNNEDELPYNPRYARQPKLETILEVSDSRRGSGDLEGQGKTISDFIFYHVKIITIFEFFSELSPSKIPLDQLKAKRYRTSSKNGFYTIFSNLTFNSRWNLCFFIELKSCHLVRLFLNSSFVLIDFCSLLDLFVEPCLYFFNLIFQVLYFMDLYLTS